MKTFCLTLASFVLLLSSSLAAERVALVIGVNHYGAFPEDKQLTSPNHDAADMAAKLRQVGFSVLKPVLDGTRESIVRAKQQFMEEAKGAQVAVFYFSGHGFQVGDENYLIPSDMPKISSFTVLRENAIQLRDSVMAGLEEAGASTKVIILDCCRDNPFASQIASALGTKTLRTKGGTGEITGYGPGFFLAFASSPGAEALDGNGGRNSPFTAALLTHLQDKAGQNIRDLFDEVKSTVQETHGTEQVPWVNDSLNKEHIKVLAKLTITTPPAPLPNPGMTEAEIERRALAKAQELAARVAAEAAAGNGQSPMGNKPSTIPNLPSALANDTATPGQVMEIKLPGGVPMKFCYCPPGSFTMGSPKSEKDRGRDEDQVQVRISKGFWMAQTEVTQRQWVALMGSNPSYFFKGNDLPVERVSWEDAQSFISKLNQSVTLPSGWKYVLPTEAQWEYACRAGTESAFHFGDTLNGKQANCAEKSLYGTSTIGQTCDVGSYQPNGWGLYDMHGNVDEWCADWYGEKLAGGTDPVGVSSGAYRARRGGWWQRDAAHCRAAFRNRVEPGGCNYTVGFRPALVPSR